MDRLYVSGVFYEVPSCFGTWFMSLQLECQEAGLVEEDMGTREHVGRQPKPTHKEHVWDAGGSRFQPLSVGFGKRGLLEKGSFRKVHFLDLEDSRGSRESRDSREPPDCGKQGRIRPFPRDSRESIDLRFLQWKDPFGNDPFFRSWLCASGEHLLSCTRSSVVLMLNNNPI